MLATYSLHKLVANLEYQAAPYGLPYILPFYNSFHLLLHCPKIIPIYPYVIPAISLYVDLTHSGLDQAFPVLLEILLHRNGLGFRAQGVPNLKIRSGATLSTCSTYTQDFAT